MREVSLRELLEMSIEEERKSQELYRRAASLVQEARAKRFLELLLEEESNHERELREVLESADLDAYTVGVGADALEAGSLQHGPEGEAIEETETARGLLLLALKREKRANLLYSRMAEAANEPSLRALLVKLAASEEDHAARIREHFKLRR